MTIISCRGNYGEVLILMICDSLVLFVGIYLLIVLLL